MDRIAIHGVVDVVVEITSDFLNFQDREGSDVGIGIPLRNGLSDPEFRCFLLLFLGDHTSTISREM